MPLMDTAVTDSVGYNFAEAIASIRGPEQRFGQFSDDQLRFIIRQRNYFAMVKSIGLAETLEAGQDAYSCTWLALTDAEIRILAELITHNGVAIDPMTLTSVLSADAPYVQKIFGLADSDIAALGKPADPYNTNASVELAQLAKDVANPYMFGSSLPNNVNTEDVAFERTVHKYGKVLAVVLMVLVVAIIGLVAWLLYDSRKEDKPTQSDSMSVEEDAEEESSPVIKEWNVAYTVPASLGEVKHVYDAASDRIALISSKQDDLPVACAQKTGNEMAEKSWGITRLTPEGAAESYDEAALPNLLRIGTYYYVRFYPQQGCEEGAALDEGFKQLYLSLREF